MAIVDPAADAFAASDRAECGGRRRSAASARRGCRSRRWSLVLLLFFGLPMLVVLAVSFFDFSRTEIIPAFIFDNYIDLFRSEVTLRLYASSLKFALIVWAVTLVLGFNIAYFLVFHVRGLLFQIGLFLLCTVPFLTSNIIRMISWIPFLGRNGIFNQALQGAGVTSQPLEFLLFSDFAVIVAYVHLFTLFMVVPIFNSMARIDKSLLEAARDAGAGRFRVVAEVVCPLSRTGIALGSIFVVTLVMGDFFVVRTMSGGQSASVVSALQNEVAALQYPPAAASAVIMVIIVTLMVAAILRVVDVRKELGGVGGMHGDDTRPWTFYAFAAFFTLFVLFLYGPMFVIYILSFQGPNGGMTFPLNGVSLHWFNALISQTRVGDIAGSFVRSIGLAAIVAVVTVVLSVLAGLAFRVASAARPSPSISPSRA